MSPHPRPASSQVPGCPLPSAPPSQFPVTKPGCLIHTREELADPPAAAPARVPQTLPQAGLGGRAVTSNELQPLACCPQDPPHPLPGPQPSLPSSGRMGDEARGRLKLPSCLQTPDADGHPDKGECPRSREPRKWCRSGEGGAVVNVSWGGTCPRVQLSPWASLVIPCRPRTDLRAQGGHVADHRQ